MNRRISDLLDHCSGACFDMETDTPLSARRIRARTLAQIDAAPARRARGRMRPLRLLAAAAVVAALTLSAMAVGHALGAGELFRSYFSAAGGEDLSPEQVAVLDQVGTIEPGKLADIAAWNRDLLTDENALLDCAFVMKDGVEYETECGLDG